ncbi:hypothetical protein PR048_031317 [Dryococelus australis]|uniref:Uncharacterized protein n=1 Tax=Dryococelus australis TaxID=614101 RepID=A0ABQ9G4W9_9NEOP|nr:hypothetical protein PR048_031317 [Dryococelus australis]
MDLPNMSNKCSLEFTSGERAALQQSLKIPRMLLESQLQPITLFIILPKYPIAAGLYKFHEGMQAVKAEGRLGCPAMRQRTVYVLAKPAGMLSAIKRVAIVQNMPERGFGDRGHTNGARDVGASVEHGFVKFLHRQPPAKFAVTRRADWLENIPRYAGRRVVIRHEHGPVWVELDSRVSSLSGLQLLRTAFILRFSLVQENLKTSGSCYNHKHMSAGRLRNTPCRAVSEGRTSCSQMHANGKRQRTSARLIHGPGESKGHSSYLAFVRQKSVLRGEAKDKSKYVDFDRYDRYDFDRFRRISAAVLKLDSQPSVASVSRPSVRRSRVLRPIAGQLFFPIHLICTAQRHDGNTSRPARRSDEALGVRGAAVAKRLACSPPTKANRVQSLAGSLPDFCMWESCRTMPLFGGFSRCSDAILLACGRSLRRKALLHFCMLKYSARPVAGTVGLSPCCARPGSAASGGGRNQRPEECFDRYMIDFERTMLSKSVATRQIYTLWSEDLVILIVDRLLPAFSDLLYCFAPGLTDFDLGAFPLQLSAKVFKRVTPGFSHVGIAANAAIGRRVFSGISRFPPPSFQHCSILTSITLISSQDLAVKSRPNLFTHSHSQSLCQSDTRSLPRASRSRSENGHSNINTLMSAQIYWHLRQIRSESPVSTTARTPVLLVPVLELTIVLLVHTTPDTTLSCKLAEDFCDHLVASDLRIIRDHFHKFSTLFQGTEVFEAVLFTTQVIVMMYRTIRYQNMRTVSRALEWGKWDTPEESPPTSGIVRHDSRVRTSGNDTHRRIEPRSFRSGATRILPRRAGFDYRRGRPPPRLTNVDIVSRAIPLVGGFSRGSPVSPTPCIPTLRHTRLPSPSSTLKTSTLGASHNLSALQSPCSRSLTGCARLETGFCVSDWFLCVANEQTRHGCAVFVRLVFNKTSQEHDSALGSPMVDDRPIMNAVKYRVVSGVVWTNRTMVSSNTDTNRTGVLAVVGYR